METQTGVTDMTTEQKIAADLDSCDLGMALTGGKLRNRYKKHREECFAEIRRMNERDGYGEMADDELLKELLA